MQVTLSDAVARYVRARRERQEVRPGTLRTMRYTLGTLADCAGADLPVSRIRRAHVERWLGRRDLSPASRRSQLSIVRMFCEWAVTAGLLAKDPTVGIRIARQPRYMPRGLRLDQVQAVLAACPDTRSELVVLLMVQCGLRSCEVATIELGDIDFGDRVLLVREGKGGHQRVLPIPGEAWDAIGRYLRARPVPAGPLIRKERGRGGVGAKYLSRYVSQLMHSAGVEAGGHALRHTCAGDLLRSGVHLRNVQRVLGHESIATTERYLPWVVGDLREAVEGRTYKPDRRSKHREALGGDESDDAA